MAKSILLKAIRQRISSWETMKDMLNMCDLPIGNGRDKTIKRLEENEQLGASQFCKKRVKIPVYSRLQLANKWGLYINTRIRENYLCSISRSRPMTPEDKKQLDAHVKAIAKILYKNTPPSKIETFEGIETAVRDQVLEHVSPKIAFFLSEKKRERPEDAAEP